MIVLRRPFRAMCKRVAVTVAQPPTRVAGASIVTVRLKNGRGIVREVEEFDGTPSRPLSRAELRDKFMMLMGAPNAARAAELFERLQNLEHQADIRWLCAYWVRRAHKTIARSDFASAPSSRHVAAHRKPGLCARPLASGPAFIDRARRGRD
jgi:hypothetical protein